MTGWGKAGVRLTEQEREQVRRRAARRRNEQSAREEAWAEEAHRAWSRGRIIPQQITAALDMRGLEGPEVDTQCAAEEPEVDQWEAGELYPTWEQFIALARLTEFPLRFFYAQHAQIDGGFICGSGPGGGCQSIEEPTGPLRFAREVVAKCPDTEWAEGS